MTKFVKQIIFLPVVFLFILFLSPTTLWGEEVKVELLWKFPEANWLEIEVRTGNYDIYFDGEAIKLLAGEKATIGRSFFSNFILLDEAFWLLKGDKILLLTKNMGVFRIREPGKDWISYRGSLDLVKEDLKWRLYNTLDSEDYLKGVVPVEMSNAWAVQGMEALKAQAVAARTYLWKHIGLKGTITDSPDIHQAYWGKTVEGEASVAVELTKEEILVDTLTLQPISVFYSSHNGGYTEETQNVWKANDPHYVSMPDPHSANIGGYLNHWQFVIDADTLGQSFELGPIRSVILHSYPSGRVYEVELHDWLGNSKTTSGGKFVQSFYPYNQQLSEDSFLGRLFQVQKIPPRKEGQWIRNPIGFSERILNRKNRAIGPGSIILQNSDEGVGQKEFGLFIFRGRGWGHGVGMSQWGAYNMAQNGFTYDHILAYYYKNSTLQKRP